MMSVIDFNYRYNLKNKASWHIKSQHILSSLALNDELGTYLRDGRISTFMGIFNLHPTEGTPWVVKINGNYFVAK